MSREQMTAEYTMDAVMPLEMPEGLKGIASGARIRCGAAGCASVMPFWKRARRPSLEGRWACSKECLETLVEQMVRREMGDVSLIDNVGHHQHRVPLGLVLLAQGLITQQELKQALSAQRNAGQGRIGDWLMQVCGIAEAQVTRALGVQWNSQVLNTASATPRQMAMAMPRELRMRFAVAPLRLAGGQTLELAAEERVDAAVAFALERMSGVNVASGLVQRSAFQNLEERLNESRAIPCQEWSARSTSQAAGVLAGALGSVQPEESRLVSAHGVLWLRMWREGSQPKSSNRLPLNLAGIEDVVVTLAGFGMDA